MPGPMYRVPDPEICQGDIVDDVPHVLLGPPLQVIRRITVRGGRDQWAPFPYPPVEGQMPDSPREGKSINLPPFHPKEGEFVPAMAQFTRAVVLSFDCDAENDTEHCLIAIVRKFSGVHEEDRPTIRNNQCYDAFYLEPDPELGLEEAYVDFTHITSLAPDLVDQLGKKRASLSEIGLQAFHFSFFRFVTRRDLEGRVIDRGSVKPPASGSS